MVYSDIQKSAEGDKVIGKTGSGKTVYGWEGHPGHKDFTEQDHKDAADMHQIKMEGHLSEARRQGKHYDHPDFIEKIQHHKRGMIGHRVAAYTKHMGWSMTDKKVVPFISATSPSDTHVSSADTTRIENVHNIKNLLLIYL